MPTMLKDPPSFVTNIGAWDYTLAKLALLDDEKPKAKPRLDEGGNPTNYAQAVAIYKAVCKKYPAFQTGNVHVEPIKQNLKADPGNHTFARIADSYPVGKMFWYDDVLCEAVAYAGGMAVYPDADGVLYIRAKVLDVDPEGAHRKWPVGKINGFPPHRCADLDAA